MTKPSTNSAPGERVLVCQRVNELSDLVALLGELGAEVEVVSGALPEPAQAAKARLVLISGQRLAEGLTPPIQRWPRTLAVVDDASRTLSAHLARIGIAMILRRPIHPRTLRLILLHELYRGPERRGKRRVMIGQPVRAGVGLFKQAATLLELSRTGARIELANAPKPGATIQFLLDKELTGAKPIKVNARVVRVIATRGGPASGTSEIGVAIVDPKGEHTRTIEAILQRYANGTTGSRDAAGSGASQRTTSATSAARLPPTTPTPIKRTLPPGAGTERLPPSTAVAAAQTTTPPPGAAEPISSPQSGDESAPEPRRLPPSFSPELGSRPSPAPTQVPAPDASAECALDAPHDTLAPLALDRAARTIEVVADESTLEPLEGDESDLDFELELDDEIAIEPFGASTVAGADRSAGEANTNEEGAVDRRSAVRVPYPRRVVALDEQAARVVVGRDLSYGGVRIEANPELALGDVLKLALHAGTETEPLIVLGAVERDEGERGLVLVFAQLTPGQRERLEKIVAASNAIESPGDVTGTADGIVVGELLGRVARATGLRRGAGFTIIELMIVAAILGMIASIAIPLFARYQLRAKSSEVKTNLGAIRVVEESNFAEHGVYLSAAAEPPIVPGPLPTSFDIVGTDFAQLGWSPEGQVYFSYAVAISADEAGYTADAAADIDGDGILQVWGYSKPDPLGALTPGGLGCNPALLDPEEVATCTAGGSPF